MRRIEDIRAFGREVGTSLNAFNTSFITTGNALYCEANDTSMAWKKRFIDGAISPVGVPCKSEEPFGVLCKFDEKRVKTFCDAVFALKYATLLLKAVQKRLTQDNYQANLEYYKVDPATGILYDWRIKGLLEIREEAYLEVIGIGIKEFHLNITDADTNELEY